jgi:acyl-coenzyme A thioesterase PaaI-like protein
MEDNPDVRNHVNTIHAGALFALGQKSIAMFIKQNSLEVTPSELNFSISYKKPARGTIYSITTYDDKQVRFHTALLNKDEVMVVEITASKRGGN